MLCYFHVWNKQFCYFHGCYFIAEMSYFATKHKINRHFVYFLQVTGTTRKMPSDWSRGIPESCRILPPSLYSLSYVYYSSLYFVTRSIYSRNKNGSHRFFLKAQGKVTWLDPIILILLLFCNDVSKTSVYISTLRRRIYADNEHHNMEVLKFLD